MNYTLLYSKSAAKDIKELDAIVKRRLKKKLEVYILKPLYYAKKLTDNDIGTYRWRMGNYRIVFDIDGKNIVILRIGHRREIYR